MVLTKPPEESGGKGTGSGGSRSSYEAPGAWCSWNPASAATRKGEEAATRAGGAGEAAIREDGAQDSAANVSGSCTYAAAQAWHGFAYTVAGTVLSMLDQDKALKLAREREYQTQTDTSGSYLDGCWEALAMVPGNREV